MVAIRLEDVASPLRNGGPLADGDRSALVIGGTARIRTGEVTVFCKVVAVAPAGSGGTAGFRRRAARLRTRRWARWRTGWRRRPGRA